MRIKKRDDGDAEQICRRCVSRLAIRTTFDALARASAAAPHWRNEESHNAPAPSAAQLRRT